MATDWPFADPPNLATFTVRQIVDRKRPILLVYHDEDDGSWQFLTGEAIDMADAMLVTLRTIVGVDATVLELADLEVGWRARRTDACAPWVREKAPSTEGAA